MLISTQAKCWCSKSGCDNNCLSRLSWDIKPTKQCAAIHNSRLMSGDRLIKDCLDHSDELPSSSCSSNRQELIKSSSIIIIIKSVRPWSGKKHHPKTLRSSSNNHRWFAKLFIALVHFVAHLDRSTNVDYPNNKLCVLLSCNHTGKESTDKSSSKFPSKAMFFAQISASISNIEYNNQHISLVCVCVDYINKSFTAFS